MCTFSYHTVMLSAHIKDIASDMLILRQIGWLLHTLSISFNSPKVGFERRKREREREREKHGTKLCDNSCHLSSVGKKKKNPHTYPPTSILGPSVLLCNTNLLVEMTCLIVTVSWLKRDPHGAMHQVTPCGPNLDDVFVCWVINTMHGGREER